MAKVNQILSYSRSALEVSSVSDQSENDDITGNKDNNVSSNYSKLVENYHKSEEIQKCSTFNNKAATVWHRRLEKAVGVKAINCQLKSNILRKPV